jgi:glycerophosphoryl diester phosphodiesterase
MGRVRGPLVDVVAHRGASAYAPENSFEAFDLALEQGADVLELDVRAAGDGQLVLVHDPTLERLAGDPRSIAGLTRAAIAALDAVARPASFDAFLDRYAGAARLLIDLKDPSPEWEARVIDAIERHGLHGRVLVQSFDLDALLRLHEAAPWQPLAPLVPRETPPLDVLAVAAGFADGIGPWHGAVDAALVEAVHGAGLAIRPWTVDDPADMRALLALGVDAIVTNAPDVGVAAVRGGPA